LEGWRVRYASTHLKYNTAFGIFSMLIPPFLYCIHQLWYSLKRIISHYNCTKHAIQNILPVAIHAMLHGIPHHIQVIVPFAQRDVHSRVF